MPGFYDDVVPLTDEERRQFAALPFDEQEYLRRAGRRRAGRGEEGYTTLERRWARPTFDICGLTSGYQGEGAKTVLPATASAKFSFRLVPDQDPDKITAGLRKILAEVCPPGISMELIEHHGSPGVLVLAGQPLRRGGRPGHRTRLRRAARLHPRRRLDSRRGHLRPKPRRRLRCCWAGARTTTTPTAPTKSFRWIVIGGQRGLARSFGKSWDG